MPVKKLVMQIDEYGHLTCMHESIVKCAEAHNVSAKQIYNAIHQFPFKRVNGFTFTSQDFFNKLEVWWPHSMLPIEVSPYGRIKTSQGIILGTKKFDLVRNEYYKEVFMFGERYVLQALINDAAQHCIDSLLNKPTDNAD